MSSVFSKNKKKRQRSSSSEGNTSFVKNVTSRVSAFLPSTITKWFSSPSSSNTNGSAPAADVSDSSTDDEGLDSPAMTEPPLKRMRYNSQTKHDHFSQTDANCSFSYTKTKTSELTYNSYNATPFPTRSTLNTPVISPNEDTEGTEQNAREPKKYKSEHTVTSVGQSAAGKRKSLFDTVVSEQSKKGCTQKSLNSLCGVKEPYFKSALFVSPFYTGRTMYGGAASSYVNQPNIKQKKVAVVNKSYSSDDSAISNSARRVMDLLEQYSSPLVDARRIPHYTKPKNDSFNNSTDRNSSSYSNRNTSYKTQELHVPNMASILRLKQKSRLMDTTSAARQIIASHSSTPDYLYPSSSHWKQTEVEQSNKMTTKVKTRVARTNRGNQNDFEVTTPVKLQAVVLQIDQDKLPKFSFGTPAAQLPGPATSTPKSTFEGSINKPSTELPSNKEPVNHFTFSNPERLPCDISGDDTMIPKYQFYSPERSIEQKKDSMFTAVGATEKTSQNPIVKTNDWKCSECWVSNKTDANKCVCCGAKQPSKKPEKCAKCTMCKLADSQALKDKCVNCEKMPISNVASPIVAPAVNDVSKWKCDECWVSNDVNAEKCACCGAAKAKKSAASAIQTNAVPLAAKLAGAEWKCDECWISNKGSADKCAACGSAKPGNKAGAAAPAAAASGSSFFGTSSDTLKNIVQTQKKETWECQSCLVRNEVNVSSCVCCGTERENKNKMPGNKFNFGLNTSFKFGINPKQPELESTLPNTLKEQSEKNNNILAETPTFTLTLPIKKPEEKTESSISKVNEVPKPSFTFGIPKQSTPAPATTFKSLSPAKAVQEEEKPQEVPQMKLSAPDQSKPLGGMFSSPQTLSPPSSIPAQSTSTAFTTPSADAKIEVASVSITLKPPAMTAEKPQHQNTFSFAASSLKPAVFGTATTTAASGARNLFTPPSQTTVASTTAPTMSFFKAPESTAPSLFENPTPVTTSTVPLFQSGETTTTAAPSSVAPTAHIFSFGNKIAASTAPAPDKSAIFSFGNNAPKADAPTPMFKSPFDAAPESNTNNIMFTLGSMNVMGSSVPGGSNSLASGGNASSATLTSGSGAGTINPLGGPNGLSTNPLPAGNGLQSGSGISGSAPNLFASIKKENVWSPNTPPANMFVPNTTASSLQKPGFTFGSPGGFNAGSSTSAFGGNAQPAQSNIFGMANQNNNNNNNNQPSMFSSPVQSQQPAPMFGAPQPAAANPAPQMGMFGSPAVGATQSFSAQNQSITSFEAPSMTPAPTPSFNFGGQQTTGMFGFGQQQQPQQAGVYNFGGTPATGGMQFTMGSGVNTAGRRVRKAVRRNPPR